LAQAIWPRLPEQAHETAVRPQPTLGPAAIRAEGSPEQAGRRQRVRVEGARPACARGRALMPGLLQVLFFEVVFRQALVEVVLAKMFLVVAIMASVKGFPPDEWKCALAVLCLSLTRAVIFLAGTGRCSPGGGALASRRTWLMYSHGSCMSILICGGYAYLFLDLLGYAADPPDRPPFAAMTLVCQVPTLFLGFLWVFSCFGPVDASRRDALARAKSLERIPVSLSQIETFAFCPDSSGSFESTCIICMDDFAEGCDIGRLPCSHFFHDGCIREWLGSKDSCPMRCSANRGASAFGRSMYP